MKRLIKTNYKLSEVKKMFSFSKNNEADFPDLYCANITFKWFMSASKKYVLNIFVITMK